MAIKQLKFEMNRFFPGLLSSDVLMKEIGLMQGAKFLENTNLVKFLGFYIDEKTDILTGANESILYIIQELCDKNLQQHLMSKGGNISEEEAVHLGLQILQGLKELHEKGFNHRNLHLDNILFKGDVCKISDLVLGIDKEIHSTVIRRNDFCAPESLKNETASVAADIWTFGVIMHTAIFGEHPFSTRGLSEQQTVMSVALDPYLIPNRPVISPECRDMLMKCLEKDPALRIKAVELCQHEFFTGAKLPGVPPKVAEEMNPLNQDVKSQFEKLGKF